MTVDEVDGGSPFGDAITEPIRLLHVDDDPAFLEVAAAFLSRELPDAEVLTAESASAGLSHLESERVDCVVSDYDMPETDGLAFLSVVRARYDDLPFILFTGKGSEEIASEAISAGVTDYLQKGTGTDQYAVLANRVGGYVDRKRTAEALAESQRRLSRLIGNLPGSVYRCRNEPGWPMEFVSEGCVDLTGYTAEEFVSGAVSWGRDVVHPDDREPTWEAVQDALEADEPFEITYRIRTADGEQRIAWEQGVGVVDEAGELEALEGFVTDITERVALDTSRRAVTRQLEAIVEASPEPIIALDRDGRVTLWNGAAEETFGWRAAEVLGEPAPNVPEDRADEFRDLRRAVLGGEVTTELEVARVTKSGEEIAVSLSNAPVYGPDGEVVGSMAVVRDLGDRRELESELLETATLLGTIVDASPEPIVALDRDGNVTLWNRAAEETFGWRAAEVLGEPAPNVPDEEREQHREMVDRVEAGGPVTDAEIVRRTRDGKRLTLRISSGPLRNADGEVVGTMGVLSDETELRAREREADFHRQLVEKVGVGVAVYGDDGRFVYVNDHLAELLGRTPDDVVGTPLWKYNPNFDPERLSDYWDSIPPGTTRLYEIDLHRADGTTVPVETLITREDIQGTPYHFGTIRDVSTRLALDAELRETARELEAVVEASPEAIVAVGADGRVLLWNVAAEATFGPSAASARGADVDVLPPAIASHLRDRLAGASGDRSSSEAEFAAETADGTRIDVSVSTAPLGDPDEGLAGLVAVIADVGDRKAHERLVTRLHDATRELMAAETPRAIADLVIATTTKVLGFPYAAVMLWDEEIEALRVVADTPEAREKTLSPPRTLRRGEGISGTVFDTGEPAVIEDRLTSEWIIVQEDTGVRSACILPLGEHGVYVLSSDVPGAFDDRDVDVAKLLAANAEAALDRSSREGTLRRRETELKRQNERLERFAGVLSHDLRNPLNVALGYLRAIEAERDDLAAVERAVERMNQIVDDVLAITREGRGVRDPVPVDAEAVVRDAWEAVDTGRAELECSLSGTVPADAVRLGRLFENLFRNGVDHAGPDVPIRVGPLPDGFYVEDDGPGIPPERREAVFEFGYTTAGSGTGFGLAIVREIAEAHGWRIRTTEGSDGGARFEVTGVEWADG